MKLYAIKYIKNADFFNKYMHKKKRVNINSKPNLTYTFGCVFKMYFIRKYY